MGRVTGLQRRLNETTQEKGFTQHLGHKKSSGMLAAMIAFPFTTTTGACTVVLHVSASHSNCISALQCEHHRQENRGPER